MVEGFMAVVLEAAVTVFFRVAVAGFLTTFLFVEVDATGEEPILANSDINAGINVFTTASRFDGFVKDLRAEDFSRSFLAISSAAEVVFF